MNTPPRPAQSQRIPHGIWGAVLLPLSADEIDWQKLDVELEILCHSALHGIYTNGTAGEFHNQTEAEFERLSELVAEHATAAGKPFQIGVSHSNPRIARKRLIRVRDLSPTGIQFTLPDWWCLSANELERFAIGMQTAAEDTPLILYNPPHAKHILTLQQIADLREFMPTLVGAKLPAGDAAWYAERRRLLPDFSVFVPGHALAFGRPLGADGAYSNVACLSPDGALLHWQLIESDPPAAQALEQRINAFMQTHVVSLARQRGLSNIALDKLMAAAGAWGPVEATLLWPYASATEVEIKCVAEAAREMLPEFFAE